MRNFLLCILPSLTGILIFDKYFLLYSYVCMVHLGGKLKGGYFLLFFPIYIVEVGSPSTSFREPNTFQGEEETYVCDVQSY